MAGAITAQAWPPPQSLEVQPLGPLRPIHITITITTTATTASRTLAAITAATTTNRTLAAITAATTTNRILAAITAATTTNRTLVTITAATPTRATLPDGRRCFRATTAAIATDGYYGGYANRSLRHRTADA